MPNKNNFLILLCLLSSAIAVAQPSTISPYSKYEPGVIRPQTFARNFGMGGTGVGLRSNREIGLLNPASYSALAATTFDVGYTSNSLWLTDGTENQVRTKSYIDHIVFGFPIVKKTWGMSFGVLPYANTGYSYNKIIEDPSAGSVSVFENGDGAINKAYLGNGFALRLDSTSNISVGANAYFLFGTIKAEKTVLYGDLLGAHNILKEESITVADFGYDVGIQYQKTIAKPNKTPYIIVVGATYGPAIDYATNADERQFTFSGTDEIVANGEVEDSIFYALDVEGIMQLPSKMGVGFSVEKEREWLIAADYTTSDWGSIASNSEVFNYTSNYSINVGGQYTPQHDGQNYFQRVAYRAGGRFSTSHLEINNESWNEYGITFGFGLPVRRAENSYPRLNFGMEYGKRGTTEAGLIKETFVNFNFGITINATWFRKRKYD